MGCGGQKSGGSTAVHLDAKADVTGQTLNVVLQIPSQDLYFRRVNDQLAADLDLGLAERGTVEWSRLRSDKATVTMQNQQANTSTSAIRISKSWALNPERQLPGSLCAIVSPADTGCSTCRSKHSARSNHDEKCECRAQLQLRHSGAVFAAALVTGQSVRPPKPYTTWSDYGGSPDSMQYSALTQINRNNVKQLETAWFYPVAGEPERMPFSPLVVDDVMYVAGVKGSVVALNAETGKELWIYPEEVASERGISYWESKDRSDRRLIVTARGGVREIDARTGKLIESFGTKGFVDFRTGSPRRLAGPNLTPPRIFENLMIVGSNTGENFGSPPGDIRAYDVLTGKLVWTFHTIPRPGEFGYDTWPQEAWQYAAARTTGVKCRWTQRTPSCSCRPDRPRPTCTAPIVLGTICSAIACWPSTRAPASGCGIFRRSITTCGITTSPRRPSC
jgi:hypothetical protein